MKQTKPPFKKRKPLYGVIAVVAVAAVGGFWLIGSLSTAETTVAALAGETHFHGIAVDQSDPSRLYLATHHGLYVIAPDGTARQISGTRDDFMGFTPHPTDPAILYASGHPARGGNLGFIASTDGGKSWAKLSDGIRGPVDFHQMDASKADPKVIYGVYGDLQRSSDGGRSWTRVGPAPEGLIGLATSSKDPDTLYAATQGGLLKSVDAGRSWKAAYSRGQTTMVHVTRGGEVYAFVVGTGLVQAKEPALEWQVLGGGPDGYILHFAVGPSDERTLHAVAVDPQSHIPAIVVSRDGGKTWSTLGGTTK